MSRTIVRAGAVVAAALSAGCAQTPSVRLAGAECARPPPLHCPDEACPAGTLAGAGPAIDPVTGRSYFLDYPCDLAPGEDVTLVLSLHGAGATGNWHRHYFPLLDHVDEHRLVVATPSAPTRIWALSDDAHLESIVSTLIDEIGPENVRSFWLAGHSYGGMTSNRLACTDFFRDKVDGWLSLSGGRIGPAAVPDTFARAERDLGSFPSIEGENGPERAAPGAAVTPACDISYIFATGEHEIAALPDASPWADKHRCGARAREPDVVDEAAGYVGSASRPGGEDPAWGRAPRPGRAAVYVYPGCADGRLVADVVRLDKGHTEGLEPRVTERLVEMMASAPGGKMREGPG